MRIKATFTLADACTWNPSVTCVSSSDFSVKAACAKSSTLTDAPIMPKSTLPCKSP